MGDIQDPYSSSIKTYGIIFWDVVRQCRTILPKSIIKSFGAHSRVECALPGVLRCLVNIIYTSCLSSGVKTWWSQVHSGFIKQKPAHTLREWDEKCMISSLDRSGWHAFMMDWSTSSILLAVRYLRMPWWLTKIPIGWSSNWPRRLACRWILECCAHRTDMRMLVIRNKSYGLTILTILLNPEC